MGEFDGWSLEDMMGFALLHNIDSTKMYFKDRAPQPVKRNRSRIEIPFRGKTHIIKVGKYE